MKSAVQHKIRVIATQQRKASPMTNLMTDIDKRFDLTAVQTPVRYISADEMAYLRARAQTLRAQSFKAAFAAIANAFRARPVEWAAGSIVTAK